MKNTILLPFLMLLGLNCLGQNTIIDITENKGDNVDGAPLVLLYARHERDAGLYFVLDKKQYLFQKESRGEL